MQHALVDLQQKKWSSYSISIFVISLFGCTPALDAWGLGPVRHPPLHATVEILLVTTPRTFAEAVDSKPKALLELRPLYSILT